MTCHKETSLAGVEGGQPTATMVDNTSADDDVASKLEILHELGQPSDAERNAADLLDIPAEKVDLTDRSTVNEILKRSGIDGDWLKRYTETFGTYRGRKWRAHAVRLLGKVYVIDEKYGFNGWTVQTVVAPRKSQGSEEKMAMERLAFISEKDHDDE